MRASSSSLFGLVVLAGAAVVGLGAWEHVQTERLGARIAGAARPGDIAMISSETCSYCGAARAWFQEHRVNFAECFIETDATCATRYRDLMAPGTPVLVVRGEPQLGFSARRIAAALER